MVRLPPHINKHPGVNCIKLTQNMKLKPNMAYFMHCSALDRPDFMLIQVISKQQQIFLLFSYV